MECSAFFTLAFREPKRQVTERVNERALFQDCLAAFSSLMVSQLVSRHDGNNGLN